MSEYPRCFLDDDGWRIVYESQNKAWCGSQKRMHVWLLGDAYTPEFRLDDGSRELSTDEFLRAYGDEPIAYKLRELLKPKETPAEKRTRLQELIDAAQAELDRIPKDEHFSIAGVPMRIDVDGLLYVECGDGDWREFPPGDQRELRDRIDENLKRLEGK